MLKIFERIRICRSKFFCAADLVLIMFPREFESVFRRRFLIDTRGKCFEYNNVSEPFDASMGFQLLNRIHIALLDTQLIASNSKDENFQQYLR